jgi:hypothetical protein
MIPIVKTIAELAKIISAKLIFLFTKAFMRETPMTINRYVISLIGIDSVRYLIIPNIAKSPMAKPISNLYFLSVKHKKKTIRPIK